MQFINTFQGGMDKDLLKSILPKNKYIDARNIRLVTDKGSSTGALTNTFGNTQFKDIPDTYQVYKLTWASNGNTTITVNGQTTSSITTSGGILNTLATYTALSALSNFGVSFSAAYSSTYVLIWGLTQNPVITFGTGGVITSTLFVAAQATLEPIGWTKIRDNIILFTTNVSNSTGGVGQIWKVTYNKQTIYNSPSTSATYTLLYNNDLKFTKQKPICQLGQTEGRYENSTTQNIYWTDNFNNLRRFNIADPQGFALDPTLLETSSPFSLSVPLLNKINDSGGSVPIGNWACAFRLKNTGGGTTTFSPISNPLKLIGTASTGSFRDQFGTNAGSVSSKSITWDINGLDTDYDRIELAVLYWPNPQTLPTINVVFDEPISPSGNMSFTFTDTEDKIPITIDEFAESTATFTRCKTIFSKDNRLFVGNVANTRFNITFDARALRFRSVLAPSIYARIQNSDGTVVTDVATNFSNLPAEGTHDGVNPSQVPADTTVATSFRFQSDGITIGGTGPNISYSFEAFSNSTTLYGDVTNVATPYGALGGVVSALTPMGQNFRFTNPQSGPYTLNGNSYPNNNFYTPHISPYIESLWKGYQHEETYRFGIIFYDKQGNASDVKWIGDITCPALFDVDGAGANVDFDITTVSGTDQYVKVLHPIFVVNLANLSAADQLRVSGFSIVRCPRTEDDKTVVYSGLISPTEARTADTTTYLPSISVAAGDSLYGNLGNAEQTSTGDASARANNRNLCMFYPPDYLLGSYRGFKSGDTLLIGAKLDAPSANYKAAGTTLDFFTEKLYTDSRITRQTITLDGAIEVPKGQQNMTLVGVTFDNNSWDGADCYSVGEKGILLHSTANQIDYTTDGLTKGNSGKFYCHYKTTVSNQYGGNSYTQRSTSIYMSCQHFQLLDSPSDFVSTTVNLFGGDMITTIYDTQRYIKNWISLGGGTPYKASYFNFFPCEMQHNTEWKAGITINRTGLYDTGSATSADLGEAFDLGETYVTLDLESPIQKYFPLPAVYNATEEFDNRFYYSEIKINGELEDSWGIFKSNNYWDVEGIHGPINNSFVLQDKALFFQDNAFGTLMINPIVTTTDPTGVQTVLGTGNVIQRHNYVSVNAGSKHQWGMTKSPDICLFYDIIRKKLWKFNFNQGLGQLSTTKGLDSYFTNNTRGVLYDSDNPVYTNSSYGNNIIGICATYNYRYNTFYFTFKDYKTQTIGAGDTNVFNQFTISFNEQLDCFESFHDFYPSMYINDEQIIITRNPSAVYSLYIHDISNYGIYYGTTYDSTIQFLINDQSTKTKVFDNITIESESILRTTGVADIDQTNDTWNSIRCYNSYQNTDYQTLTLNTNITRKERSWNLQIPRNRVLYTSSNSPNIFTDINATDKTYGERLRDKWLYVDLKYNNTNNYNLVTHNITSSVRISDR